MEILNFKSIKHILFDYDGILVDSEQVYFETWCSVLTEKGKKVCAEFHKGHHESEVFKQVKEFLNTNVTLKQISLHRKLLFDKIVANNGLKLIPDILPLLNLFYKKYPLSIVSNSEYELVKKGVEKTKIEKYFQKYFCYSEKLNRKPNPDLYILALETLNLNNFDVLAIEDSISGLASAQAANIPVICINSDLNIKKYCSENHIHYYNCVSEFISYLS